MKATSLGSIAITPLAVSLFALAAPSAPALPAGLQAAPPASVGPALPLADRKIGSPPSVTTTLPPDVDVRASELLRFQVTVSDADGDAASLVLLNPPAGLDGLAFSTGATPRTHELRWIVPQGMGGAQLLVFEARDAVDPTSRSRHVVSVDVLGGSENAAVLVGDVTGDGILDLIAGSEQYAAYGVPGTGAIFVWKGGATLSPAPIAELSDPGAVGDLGLFTDGGSQELSGQYLHLRDVNGDGVLDVIATCYFAGPRFEGVTRVWFGGSAGGAGVRAADAVLVDPAAAARDWAGFSTGQSVLFADVTGDGTQDLVLGAEYADVRGVVDAGAVLVWAGGATLAGSPAPLVKLVAPSATASDRLGSLLLVSSSDDEEFQQALSTVDLTGDGIPEIIGVAGNADVGGVVDAGAIYVWEGGAALAGGPAPLATLTIPAAAAFDRLGRNVLGRGLVFEDVTGDGIKDVLAPTPRADRNAALDAGAVFVWAGGGALAGAPLPTATLAIPGATGLENLAEGPGQGLRLHDLDGDGALDIVALSTTASAGGVTSSGALYVWRGGATLIGTPVPDIALFDSLASVGDMLGNTNSRQPIVLTDVTGDGRADIVTGSSVSDRDGKTGVGSIHVFAGGPGLFGASAPTATLFVSTSQSADHLCDLDPIFASGDASGAIQCADVTGDGIADVVAGAPCADVDGVNDAGAIYLWAGGSSVAGEVQESARMRVSGAQADDRLGTSNSLGVVDMIRPSFHLADVTGDGVRDVLVLASSVDVGAVQDVGAAYVFEGGSGLTGDVGPKATLRDATPAASQELGAMPRGCNGLFTSDWDGDGVLDILAAHAEGPLGPLPEAGLFLWRGGPGLAGTPAPSAYEGPLAGIGPGEGQILGFADLTGDGVLDLYAGAPGHDPGGLVDAGAILVWFGPVDDAQAPDRVLSIPGAVGGEFLGDDDV